MKRLITISFLFLSYCASAQLQQLRFRTDGYYYYDSGSDTVFLAKTSASLRSEITDALSKEGIRLPDSSDPCIPAGSIPLFGGSQISLIVFFDSKGNYGDWSARCWDKRHYDTAMSSLMRARNRFMAGNILTDKMKCLTLRNDNSFHCYGRYAKTEGRLYRDSLVLKDIFAEETGFNKTSIGKERTYHFYKFGTYPPDRMPHVYLYVDPENTR